VAVLDQRRISVTPIHFDLTDYALLDQLRQWNLDHGRIG
jgi:broad specificity polyphosphatase/5'/3'-nucleotidase SurE